MNQPVPILILDNSVTFGGAINSLENLLRSLDNRKFKPILVSGQSREHLAQHFQCKWYHYYPKRPWVDNRYYIHIANLPFFKSKSLKKFLSIFRFLYWIVLITVPEALRYYSLGRKHRVKLIHLNNHFNSQVAGIIAAKILRVPCVAHLRDFVEVDAVTKIYACAIDHHVAISSAIEANLTALKVSPSRRSLVYDAVDLSAFNAHIDCNYLESEFASFSSRPRYGIFGRLVEWKGIREFLQAAVFISSEIPEAVGFIVGGHSDGDKEFERAMHAMAIDLNLDQNVVFTGYRKDVPALMKFMDVVVHASNSPEPFGMVIIEGMAMGRPVVATQAGGALDIVIEGGNGKLVKPGAVNELADAVVELLQQPGLARKMGANGRQRVQTMFSSQHYASQMEVVFDNLLRRAKCCDN